MVAGLASAKVNVDWVLFEAIFERGNFAFSVVLTVLFTVECELVRLTSFDPLLISKSTGLLLKLV
jgi:hypothetical protein